MTRTWCEKHIPLEYVTGSIKEVVIELNDGNVYFNSLLEAATWRYDFITLILNNFEKRYQVT